MATTYEYRMWLHRLSWTSTDVETELARLSRDFGWRCVAYVDGFFLLERPVPEEHI